MANDAGVLGRICTLIGEQRANITDIVFTDRKPDFYRMVIDIEVRDMEHLTHVLTAIDADSDVAQVRRFRQAPAAATGRRAAAERRAARPPGRRGGPAHGLQATRQAAPPRAGSARRCCRGAAGGAAIEYLGHRVRRLPDTPHRIALGFACGVFASFTPFFGLHFVLAAVLAGLLRGNIVAALIGTVAGNPLTFPLIASVSLGLGRRILGYGASGRDFEPDLGRLRAGLRRALATSVLSLVRPRRAASGASSMPFVRRRPLALLRRRPAARARRRGRELLPDCGRWSPPTRRGGGRGCWRARTSGWRGRDPRLTPRAPPPITAGTHRPDARPDHDPTRPSAACGSA